MTGGDVPAPIPQPSTSPSVAAKEVVADMKPLASPTSVVDDASMRDIVVEVVVEHTKYPADFIELDQDLEGELGIDTVKQAEIMADIRERFSLQIDEDFVL